MVSVVVGGKFVGQQALEVLQERWLVDLFERALHFVQEFRVVCLELEGANCI